MSISTNSILRKLVFLLILLVFFLNGIGNRPFADPDEGRYVEIPREMVISGDYVTPRLNGLKYFEKPALFYWMQAASIKIFGINEISMRLWTVIFAVLGCLCVFLVGIRCASENVGLISAAILATYLLYYVHSRLIILDLILSVFMCGALWCFYLAFVANIKRNNSETKYLINGVYGLSAFACLAKGLIGVVLPGFIAFLWILFTNNWKKIKEILYIPGILIFLLIFLPWHIMVCYKNSDFFDFYFIHEHFVRYTTTEHQRFQPFWFFIPIAILGSFPWTGFSLIALKNSIKLACSKITSIKKSENIFLLSWIFGILGFFSLSNSKLIPYILPIFPPLAYLTGNMIAGILDTANDNFKSSTWITMIIYASLFIVFYFAKHSINDVLQNSDAVEFIFMFVIMIISSISVLICGIYYRLNVAIIIGLYLFLSVNMMWIINKAVPYYQEIKKPSTKRLAKFIKLNKKENDLVFCYRRYYQDFPVYLESIVRVVAFVGELEFGAKAEKNNRVIFLEDEFWKLWRTTEKRIFLLMSRNDYKDVFATKNNLHNILDFDKYFIVISNK